MTRSVAQLDEGPFWQVHRSAIAHHRRISAALRVDEGHMHLSLRSRAKPLPVSRHFQALFKAQQYRLLPGCSTAPRS